MRNKANATQNSCTKKEKSLVNKQEAGRQPRASRRMLQVCQPENLGGDFSSSTYEKIFVAVKLGAFRARKMKQKLCWQSRKQSVFQW